jgi:hypothetical protein
MHGGSKKSRCKGLHKYPEEQKQGTFTRFAIDPLV